ncbi:MAG: fibronectin type III domain-containing protein, partial [Bacteroidales bacterium]|nr:fibronectin type III domain-containing protein [Bacteroidales bacterium]
MRKQILNLVLIAVFLIVSLGTKAQLSITNLNTNFVIDFENTVNGVNNGTYAGTGFALTPDPGQLDANAWEIIGMSDGLKYFGDEQTTGDFARGTSLTSNTGGLYSYEVATGDWALGIQPAGSGPDMTNNAYIALKVQNNTGTDINQIKFDYDVWVYNSQNRSQIFNGEYSLDGTTWIAVTELNFETPLAQDAIPVWLSTAFTATIIEDIADGDFIYFRWFTKDNGGSGSRDKIAIDNISVNMDYDPCPAANIPFFEGFENGFTHNTTVENCWTQEALAGTNPWTANKTLTDYNRTPRTGEYNAFLRYSNTRWLFYPVNLEADENYDFTVWARQDASSGAKLTLAWGLEGNASAMTNIIVNEQAIINGEYQQVKGSFSVLSNGVYYIGIKGETTYAPYYISIDDISLDYSPTCIEPTNIQASNITPNSATITWEASFSNPDEYQIYYSTVNTAPSDDETDLEETDNNSINLIDLEHSSTYYVWVRANCGEGDYSVWIGPYSFATPLVTPIPWYEGFANTTLPNGWTNSNMTLGSSASSINDGGASGNYIYKNLWSNAVTGNFSTITIGSITGAESLSFDYKIADYAAPYTPPASGTGNFILEISTDFGETWTQIETVDNNGVAGWQNKSYPMTAYADEYVKFRITSNRTDGDYYIAFDNFNLATCLTPSGIIANNITTNSATITWEVSSSNPAGYQVYYSTTNTAPSDDETDLEETDSNSINLTDLEDNSTYYVWVRANCGEGDLSYWAGPLSFWTDCLPFTDLPYTENFDTYGTGSDAFPDCWERPVTYNSYPYIVSAYSVSS